MFAVSALDGITLFNASGTAVRLRVPGRRLLAGLVARRTLGVSVHHLTDADGTGANEKSLRDTAAVIRKHIGVDALPIASDGVYRLQLPSDSVDAWRLAELAGDASLSTTSVEELRHLLSDGCIFGNDPLNEMLESARFELLNDQRSLLARLAREAPAIGAKLGRLIEPHVERAPDNQLLAGLQARALVEMGDRRGAAHALDALSARLRDTGYGLDDDLAELRRDLVSIRTRPTERTEPSRGWCGPSDVPREVWSQVRNGEGRLPDVTVVRGGSGMGKSCLLELVEGHAEREGWAVVRAVGGDTSPDESSLLDQILGPRGHGQRADSPITELRNELIARGRGEPILVSVDDAQWLSAPSIAALTMLSTSPMPMKVAVIVAARSDSAPEAITRLTDSASHHVRLEPLDEAGVCDLVLHHDPGIGRLAVESITSALTARSGGVPGLALLLLPQHLDGTATTDRVLADPLGGVVDGLDDVALRVGRSAAALGGETRVDHLEVVSGLDASELARALGELEHRRLMRRLSAVRYESEHALVAQAFRSTCPIDEWAEINARAVPLFSDPHRRAHHLYEGLPISAQQETSHALITAARDSAVAGDPAGASRAYARAHELEPLADVSDAIVWSRSLDLTGFHRRAGEVRDAHFAELIDRHESETALRLAISGQPEAESVDGDAQLLHRLRAIDARSLNPSSSWSLAWNRVRQELLLGEGAQSDELEQVAALAHSADQRVRTALLKRHAIWVDSPHARLAVLDECRSILDEAPVETIAEYRVVRCIDLYEAGSLIGAEGELLQLGALDQLGFRRQWHLKMLGASLASDRGNHGAAEELRSDAMRISIAAGLADAEFGQLAPMFTDFMIRRELAALGPMIDGGVFDADRRTLMVAVGSQVRFAIGQVEEACRLALQVLDDAEREPGISSRFAAALVCEVLGADGDEGACERARALLRPLSGGFLMLGAGATTLGPVDRYLSFVSTGPDQLELLHAARDVASTGGAVRWEAVVERDLFELTGDEQHQARFEAIRSTLASGSLD